MVKTSFISLFVAVLAVITASSSSLAAAGKNNSKDCATGTFPPDNDVTQSSVMDSTETVEDAYVPDASGAAATYTPVVTTAVPTTTPTPVMTMAAPTAAPAPAATTVTPTSVPSIDDDSQDDISTQAPTADDNSQDDAPTQAPATDDGSQDDASTQASTTDDDSLDEATVPPTSAPSIPDDDSLDKSLDFHMGGKAFAGSAAAWTTQTGDGLLKIVFESTDNKDVRVNILSGDKKEKIAEVPVKKGQTVTWTTPLADVQDKKLYLDRWRPGLFGLPGTGGGWLQLWVPQSSEGGHLELNAKINVS